MSDFKKYSVKNLHFYVDVFPELLKKGLFLTNQIVEQPQIIDVGCGDGRLIFALYKNGFFKAEGKIVAVDISEDRIKRLKECFSSVQAIKSDALNVKLPSDSFDFVICSQLIEHVNNDAKLLLEIKRLLKPKGLLFLSSVIKKKYAIYFYHKHGTFLLDPTHVKEYGSANELVDLVKQEDFGIIGAKTNRITFPVLDIFMRVLIKCGLNFDNRFYIKHKKLSFFRKLAIPVLGYQNVDVLAQKN
jgi:ubiquinone/menaquinone biosynthesis C-methylase UbiE